MGELANAAGLVSYTRAMKIMLFAVALAAAAVGCGAGSAHDPSHTMNVRCQSVQCSNGAWVSHVHEVYPPTAGLPSEVDEFVCAWDDSDKLIAMSFNDGCFEAQ